MGCARGKVRIPILCHCWAWEGTPLLHSSLPQLHGKMTGDSSGPMCIFNIFPSCLSPDAPSLCIQPEWGPWLCSEQREEKAQEVV